MHCDRNTLCLPWNLFGGCFAKPRNDTIGAFLPERSATRGGFTRNDTIMVFQQERRVACGGVARNSTIGGFFRKEARPTVDTSQ